MNIILRRWSVRALGFLVLTVLVACLVHGGGYVGGVYEPSGYGYGGWGHGYHVGPSRGGGREGPSIPSHPRGH